MNLLSKSVVQHDIRLFIIMIIAGIASCRGKPQPLTNPGQESHAGMTCNNLCLDMLMPTNVLEFASSRNSQDEILAIAMLGNAIGFLGIKQQDMADGVDKQRNPEQVPMT